MGLYSEDLRSMRGAVKDIKPNASSEGIDRALNKRVRDVVNGRTWSDLMRMVTLAIPASYTTGTVTLTQGYNVVTGAATAWPVTNEINTVSPLQVRLPGYTKIKPQSMAGIIGGKWLLIDSANPTLMEAVAVEETGVDYFIAKFLNTHDAGFTITKSTLAGRQLRTSFPFYTVKAVVDASTIWIDMNWGGASAAGQSYQIVQAYVQPDPYCRRLKFGFDPLQGIPLDTDQSSYEDVIRCDPQLQAINDPQVMVSLPPAAGGVAQWLLYPVQASVRAISVVCALTWPTMRADEDRPPPFINPECFVAGACADVLRTKNIPSQGRSDPYYDMEASQTYQAEFAGYVERAEQDDEARAPKALQSWMAKCIGGSSSAYEQSHPGWPGDYR